MKPSADAIQRTLSQPAFWVGAYKAREELQRLNPSVLTVQGMHRVAAIEAGLNQKHELDKIPEYLEWREMGRRHEQLRAARVVQLAELVYSPSGSGLKPIFRYRAAEAQSIPDPIANRS